jgi:hypothetical protein
VSIIDTSLFLDGALRLAAHGPTHGGTILLLVPTGEQAQLDSRFTKEAEQYLTMLSDLEDEPEDAFREVARIYGAGSADRYHGVDHG